jgi:hypothetical protein
MDTVRITSASDFTHPFLAAAFIPDGRDEYYLRNAQSAREPDAWRNLGADEIETLVKNGNTADDWDRILVADPFNAHLIKNCEFAGLVRIGRLENVMLSHHDLHVPAGMTNSRIIDCDLGDNVAVHHVRYLAHYLVGDHCMLLNIDEMHCTDHAKFGNGIVKDGEDEEVRIWLDLVNETGSRCVVPFDGMTCGDAYLWARYRDDRELMERFKAITQKRFDPRRGFYGEVGAATIIKSCRIIKDVKVGPAAYIKGANKLKNLTINSSPQEPSQIGEGVELVNGIIGPGCRIFYGCKAVRFVLGANSSLKYGARLIHSYLGDNSTVSCCEILNNLVFPAHEQHHNNSFLIASLVMGQSNLAAGATVGSNHNSRANDGEIHAGRGFWPGLCVTLKHYCRFASFCLIAKGDYPAELNVPLPFALVSNDTAHGRLLVMPAYWWLYNMYALARNAWKFRARDKRRDKTQHVEFDALAPDTAEEIFAALALLERWTAQAHRRREGRADAEESAAALRAAGRRLLEGDGADDLTVLGEAVECSRRDVHLLKVPAAYRAYGDMLHHYAMTNLLGYLADRPNATRASMADELGGRRQTDWVNLGGQLVLARDLERTKADIKSGKLDTWQDIHGDYDRLWAKYPLDKQRHAFATLLDLHGAKALDAELWHAALDRAVAIQKHVAEQVYCSRQKDYDNPFRQTTFLSSAEREAVLGTAADNSFVKQVRRETDDVARLVEEVRSRG